MNEDELRIAAQKAGFSIGQTVRALDWPSTLGARFVIEGWYFSKGYGPSAYLREPSGVEGIGAIRVIPLSRLRRVGRVLGEG